MPQSTPNSFKTLIVQQNGAILHISLNRKDALNALNASLLAELLQVFQHAKKEQSVRAVLISGEGKAFCAGADINQLATLDAQSGLEFSRYGQMVFRTLEQLGKPSLAAVHGFALGGGCELAMSATLRIASDATSFGQPEVKLGVIPGFGGTQRLSRLIGKGRALDVCLTGRMLKAPEALQFGLINEMVTQENLLNRANEILTTLTKLPPLALQNIISVIDQGYDLSLTDAMELEAAHFGLCCATKDKKEGVAAFLEKRVPAFSGE